jgi:hypothetical protein
MDHTIFAQMIQKTGRHLPGFLVIKTLYLGPSETHEPNNQRF